VKPTRKKLEKSRCGWPNPLKNRIESGSVAGMRSASWRQKCQRLQVKMGLPIRKTDRLASVFIATGFLLRKVLRLQRHSIHLFLERHLVNKTELIEHIANNADISKPQLRVHWTPRSTQ
jgi:hypothetical protein